MIKLKEIKERFVADDIVKWVNTQATSHVKLSKFWSRNPESPFSNDYDTVINCLSGVLQKPNPPKTVAERLLGRARVLAREAEKREFDAMFGSEEVPEAEDDIIDVLR